MWVILHVCHGLLSVVAGLVVVHVQLSGACVDSYGCGKSCGILNMLTHSPPPRPSGLCLAADCERLKKTCVRVGRSRGTCV